MKNTKKFVSILLAVLLAATAVTFTAAAAGGTLASHYTTNPGGSVGKQASISIDGSASDWSNDMLIATSAAWDVANHFKGAHENRLVDAYALFGAWDSTNLYIGMQFVNTTDTWQNSGEASLMENGKMRDMPLVLALSVDPSSTGLTGDLVGGGKVWGIDMTYQSHVDNLLYFHADLTGEPGLFTAADTQGNTSYTSDGLKSFTAAGINVKAIDTNVCSTINGLNYSDDPDDVYSDAADWVDYKTYKGSKGVHNTTYDTFYEMSIPLSTLGIDASYIAQNGVGAMVIGTRGASGIDSCPFDAEAMLDNATGSYSQDPSTSKEKEDSDVITVPLARIGADGDLPTPVPTTVPVTVPVTTVPTTTPSAGTVNVTATSNIFNTATISAEKGSTVTVNYDLTSAIGVVNDQWELTYDTSKLSLKSVVSPNFTTTINEYNNVVYGAGTQSKAVDFSSGKTLVSAEFDVIGTGSANVNLYMDELSVGYTQGGKLVYQNAVEDGVKKDLSSISGFSNNSVSGRAVASSGGSVSGFNLTVNSNFFGTKVIKVPSDSKKVTVDFELQSNYKLINAQWALQYDPAVLGFNENHLDSLMPGVHSFSADASTSGVIKANFANLNTENFKEKDVFITVTFNVLDAVDSQINLDLSYLGVRENGDEYYPVEESVVQSVSGVTVDGSETVSPINSQFNLGDVNLDGKVDIKDATLVQKSIAKIEKLTAEQRVLGDVNDDGALRINDVTLIQKYIAKIIANF